jgi:glycosyltransferase involved in cell wall biosynthesis
MKILFLTPQLPNPPHKGTTIRNFNLIKQLSRDHEIHLLSFIRSEDDLPWCEELRKYCRRVETVIAPAHSIARRLLAFFLSPLPDMAVRLPSAEFSEKLNAALQREDYDIIQVEGIEMARYGLESQGYDLAGALMAGMGWSAQRDPVSRACLVFDDHNAEYVLQRRAFETDRRYPRHWARALYSWVQSRRLRRYEAAICRAAGHVIAVSERDREALRAIAPAAPVTVVPNGVDSAFFTAMAPAGGYTANPSRVRHLASLVFTGTLDFRPNIDAVTWFCQEVLPLIKKEIFHIHFYIVGKSPSREIQRLTNDAAVTVTGYVPDVRPYVAQAKVYVVPIRMGSGTKLKVLEAMAMGVPVVSTTLGAEGIAVTPGEDILLADDPAAFAASVVDLLNNEPLRASMGRKGRVLMESRYDWQVIVPELARVYASLSKAQVSP